MGTQVKIGLENLLSTNPIPLKNKRLGMLCNPASVNANFKHASVLINERFPGQLTTLFSPQHGFYAEKQDNMIESDHFIEPNFKIPVYSLYGETRIPTPKMFENIDVLLVDIQDVGTRVYTFIYTVSYCLEMAAKLNKKVVILDRPNPIGGTQIEGNILKSDYSSFVGRYPIPMRHGMTMGEICLYFNSEYKIGCDLEIVKMTDWNRDMYWDQTLLPWIPPSPNLPTLYSAMVYPGQVIFEGTNISEGRGTTLPFEQFGAPFLDTDLILKDIKEDDNGCMLRPVSFEPTSGKWAESVCKGFHIHVTAPTKFKPYRLSLKILQSIIRHHESDFEFKQPPYEYEFKKLPMDLILGDKELRQQLVNLEPIDKISMQWKDELDLFKTLSRQYYLYE